MLLLLLRLRCLHRTGISSFRCRIPDMSTSASLVQQPSARLEGNNEHTDTNRPARECKPYSACLRVELPTVVRRCGCMSRSDVP